MEEFIAFIAMLVTLVIGVLVGKKKWDKGYAVFNELVCVLDEFEDIPKKISEAFADKKITKDELKDILAEVQDFVEAVQKLSEDIEEPEPVPE